MGILTTAIGRSIAILLPFMVPLSSCTRNRKDSISQYLTNGNEKYWTLIMPYPIKKYLGTRYAINGHWEPYAISQSNGKRTKYWIHEVHLWQLVNDSTLSLGTGVTYKIEYINDDVMVLNNMQTKAVSTYLKSKDQNTKPVKDASDHSMHM